MSTYTKKLAVLIAVILAVSLAATTTAIQYYNTASGLFDDPFFS
jgi:hypothetical protein